jgi:hypothetical protein
MLELARGSTLGSSSALVCQAVLVCLALSASGCILSPPIEPYDEANLGPRIQPIRPDPKSAVKNVTREFYEESSFLITLSASLYDPNPEPELHYLFWSDERGELLSSRNPRPTQEADRDEYYFGQVELEFDPCTEVQLSIPGSETITLYVSDRGFYTTSPDPTQIEVVEGAILVAYSWTLKYEAGICDSGA